VLRINQALKDKNYLYGVAQRQLPVWCGAKTITCMVWRKDKNYLYGVAHGYRSLGRFGIGLPRQMSLVFGRSSYDDRLVVVVVVSNVRVIACLNIVNVWVQVDNFVSS